MQTIALFVTVCVWLVGMYTICRVLGRAFPIWWSRLRQASLTSSKSKTAPSLSVLKRLRLRRKRGTATAGAYLARFGRWKRP